MQKIRCGLIALCILMCTVIYAEAQVSIGIGLPNVSIGINLPLFPELVPVPGYPVYYAPQLNANYFFYDGMYWVYHDDNWYASSWYNGPWGYVEPVAVPLFILRVPVRYYRQPPAYFHGWYSNAPPRWGQHWGHKWEQHRKGWNKWNRKSAPAPAPLPVYQRQYSGDRYPGRIEQQHSLRSRHYRYQPRDSVVRQHFQRHTEQRAPSPAQRGRQEKPRQISPQKQEIQRSAPRRQSGPDGQRPQQRSDRENVQRQAPAQPTPQQRPGAVQREQRAPRMQGQEHKSPDKRQTQEPDRSQGKGQNKDEERGRGRNK